MDQNHAQGDQEPTEPSDGQGVEQSSGHPKGGATNPEANKPPQESTGQESEKPKEIKIDSKPDKRFYGRIILVLRPFGGWMRTRTGTQRVLFQRHDTLVACVLGYEVIGGIETARLVIMGPPPSTPVICHGTPVAHFRIADGSFAVSGFENVN